MSWPLRDSNEPSNPGFYGSYRSDRMGIRLAEFVVERLRRRAKLPN